MYISLVYEWLNPQIPALVKKMSHMMKRAPENHIPGKMNFIFRNMNTRFSKLCASG
jgi:hypothetical protein